MGETGRIKPRYICWMLHKLGVFRGPSIHFEIVPKKKHESETLLVESLPNSPVEQQDYDPETLVFPDTAATAVDQQKKLTEERLVELTSDTEIRIRRRLQDTKGYYDRKAFKPA